MGLHAGTSPLHSESMSIGIARPGKGEIRERRYLSAGSEEGGRRRASKPDSDDSEAGPSIGQPAQPSWPGGSDLCV